MEAGQRHVVAVEAHGAAQLHGVLGQRHLEEGDVAAGDHFQHAGPVAVVGGVHVCGDEGGKRGHSLGFQLRHSAHPRRRTTTDSTFNQL